MHARLTTSGGSTRHRTGLIATIAILATCLGPAAVGASASGPASVAGTGRWLNTQPCVSVAPPPGANFACLGSSVWFGPPLDGTTVFLLSGTIDAAGELVGTLDETFTGRAGNGAQGTIHFTETIHENASGAFTIAAGAVGGTGDFCHVTGELLFTGTVSPEGTGTGPYSGHIVVPRNCR
jgi:hypothetical protein